MMWKNRTRKPKTYLKSKADHVPAVSEMIHVLPEVKAYSHGPGLWGKQHTSLRGF